MDDSCSFPFEIDNYLPRNQLHLHNDMNMVMTKNKPAGTIPTGLRFKRKSRIYSATVSKGTD